MPDSNLYQLRHELQSCLVPAHLKRSLRGGGLLEAEGNTYAAV